MEKKNLTAIVLCVIFYLAYTQYLKTKYPDMGKTKEIQSSSTHEDNNIAKSPDTGNFTPDQDPAAVVKPQNVATSSKPTPKGPTINQLTSDELTISTPGATFKFNQLTAGIDSIVLNDYRVEKDQDSALVNLVDRDFYIQGTTSPHRFKGHVDYHSQRLGDRKIKFWRTLGSWEISQTYTFPEKGFDANIEISWKNISANQADLISSVIMHETIDITSKDGGGFFPGMPTGRPHLLHSYGEDEVDRIDIKGYCEEDEFEVAASATRSTINFLGFDTQYFQKVLLPTTPNLTTTVKKLRQPSAANCPISANISQPQGLIQPGSSVTMNFKAWFGPKDLDLIQAFNQKLEDSIDLGWFGFLSKPLFQATQLAHKVTGNWGLAIILVTIFLKLLFFPLNQQAAISMNKMKKLQPEMTKIREKYKDDKPAQQQEIMKFMSTNKVNPMKGCLPILPQIPVFFSFYRVLLTSIELRHAPFFGWITDLSAADPFYITPLLLGAAMFAQQKLTPTTGMDPSQAKMMLMMPVIFTVMMLSLPSGLVLYMLVNTIISVGQQQWINRRFS